MPLVLLVSLVALFGSAGAQEPEGPAGNAGAELVAFRVCVEAATREAYSAAAECFLAYTRDHPDSAYVDEALYNAANQYDRAGQVERANAQYEQFVNAYPRDERSAALYFRIASNHERLLEFGQAVDAYTRLVRNFPAAPAAPDAQYNLSLLKATAGDHAGAAAGFQNYAATWPDAPDAIATLWRAGEQLEFVGAEAAVEFYRSYRSLHGAQDADRLLICDDKLATLYDGLGEAKQGEAYRALLLTDWADLEARGRTAEVGSDGRRVVAAARLTDILRRFDALTATRPLSGRFETDERTLERLEADTRAFRASSVADVARFRDFDASAAILYLNAKALLSYEALGREVFRCSPGFSRDECVAWTELVAARPDEFRVRAVEELSELVALARQEERWSTWVDRAEADLHDLDPERFSSPRQEVSRPADASIGWMR